MIGPLPRPHRRQIVVMAPAATLRLSTKRHIAWVESVPPSRTRNGTVFPKPGWSQMITVRDAVRQDGRYVIEGEVLIDRQGGGTVHVVYVDLTEDETRWYAVLDWDSNDWCGETVTTLCGETFVGTPETPFVYSNVIEIASCPACQTASGRTFPGDVIVAASARDRREAGL